MGLCRCLVYECLCRDVRMGTVWYEGSVCARVCVCVCSEGGSVLVMGRALSVMLG